MNIVKKIGLWTAFVLVSIIKSIITVVTFILGLVEFYLVKLNVKLAKMINNEWLNMAMCSGLTSNIHGCENIQEWCEDLQEDLA